MALSVSEGQVDGVLYPNWPQEIEAVSVAYRKEDSFLGSSSLSGRRVGWVRGYGFEDSMPRGVEYREYRKEALAIRALATGRIDYFIDYEATIRLAAQMSGLDMVQLSLSSFPQLSEAVFPIFRKDDRGSELMQLYDQRMAALRADGTLDRIFASYGSDQYPGSCPNRWCKGQPDADQKTGLSE